MTTYNLTLKQAGASSILYTPDNTHQGQIRHPGTGEPFNLTLKSTAAISIYLQTEFLETLETESNLPLEVE